MLHQAPDVIPVEFILVNAHPALADLHHRKLLANGLAQSQALMLGKTKRAGANERAPTASKALDRPRRAAPHLPGNRPSTTLLLDQLRRARSAR